VSFGQYRAMPLDPASILSNASAVIGAVGGTVGIISGIAVFARRRIRLVVTVSRNSDAHDSWHTINVANRSDLAVSYQDFALGWFVMTPLGRLYLNWAYSPEEETDVGTLPPHGTQTFRIDDERWSLALPPERRADAYLRMYIHLPSIGRGAWLPVRMSTWKDDSLRERLLRRFYAPIRPRSPDSLP
jgi:hypothetical protein